MNRKQPMQGDFSDTASNLLEAFDQVQEALELWDTLDPALRAAAKNDPMTLIDMASSPEGIQELLRAQNGPDEEPIPEPPKAQEMGGKTPEKTSTGAESGS